MNNKCRIATIAAAAAGIILVGCGNFLDKQPNGIEIKENFFSNSDQAMRATTAVYDAIAWYYSQEVDEWQFGDICSDDAEKGGENAADFAELQQFKEFRGVATFNNLYLRWTEFYQGVNRANQVIEKVPAIDMDAKLRDRLVAEAKFLRGYLYFQLMKTFGNIPLVLSELEPSEYCQAQATSAAVWAQIEKDLKEAADVLPAKYDGNNDVGRATKGAANAFLAKTCIFQSKWAEARTAAEAVISSGEYDLLPNYADIFTLAQENGRESIFECQHVTVSTTQWGDDNEGCVTSIYTGSRKSSWYGGWGFNCPTQNFVDEFKEVWGPDTIVDSIRLKASVIFESDTIWKGTPSAQKADNAMSPTKMHARKYMLEYIGTAPAMSNAPTNWRAIRYADVLLFRAEAANELGDPAAAKESLNKVRKRVNLREVTTSDKDSLRQAIYHERRVELGLEGHRFFDLVRQDRARDVLKANGFAKGKHEYFPIPQRELDACGKLVQNPYY